MPVKPSLIGYGQTSSSFNGASTAITTDQYESKLLSKYLQPPSLPTSANYQQMRIMARTGDGRGPFLAQN